MWFESRWGGIKYHGGGARMGILLSHHRPDQLDRCLRVGRILLCARCAALYPALAAVLCLGGSGRRDAWDGWVMLGLGAMGMLGWGAERARLVRHGNGPRVAAGAVLGASLGWMLAIHFREPFARPVVGQIAMIVAIWVAAEILRRVDLTGARHVRKACDGRRATPDERRSLGALGGRPDGAVDE
ncbi:MAG: hypothetical protein HYY06_19325 [Deltaproteobacteria bacterium]|nr:hypothetical protein [Deltaproteobacteria bacterium]